MNEPDSKPSPESRIAALVDQIRDIRKPFQEEAKQRERCREELIYRRTLELQAKAT